ncbi:MAG: hypothetical protein LBG88_04490 [Christensenellaceae bacterium]|nr:hypothetical protein [Christensenellaceae bacterium]
MKFWKNGFYDEQSAENDRAEVGNEDFEKCKVANAKGLDVVDKNGRPVIAYPTKDEVKENEKQNLRIMREQSCFGIINRGKLWYDNLSKQQLVELRDWYSAWLDVTATNKIPQDLDWL